MPLFLAACLCLRAAAAPDVDAAFAKFWNAKNPSDAAKAANDIAKTGASFDDVYARLRQGRTYSARGGDRRRPREPADLDGRLSLHPRRAGHLRSGAHLSGANPAARRRDAPRPFDARARSDRQAGRGRADLRACPWAGTEAPWWSDEQIDNLRAILDAVKRTYNVDENRVAVAGVSDGATGAFYVAMRDTTPYAAFLPLNGSLLVLTQEQLGIDGALFPENLRNKPFFIVNGGRDPLYPTALVEPVLQHLAKGGVEHHLPAAAVGRARHDVVARGEGRLRDLRSTSTRACRCPIA